ncbi:PepSY-associated TM helix domain-containing protein [Oceanibaculum sp.]|uniref:PepSY-associated TM helix domain-containing protein n=1 Tax=Oceanibaculum sp. TaxID=1903597 RepID=UPI002587420C|nr:PepSY-associated TM helix domain-containing protein [Oceanibaculum sp.]MCH2393941.1 PepSY domain-containing protein [Oceanibaculum sp.]
MEQGFRASMNWLHTWAGVVIGALLFAIFWMGTLSVFDREIDRWMMPMTRLAPMEAPVKLDALRDILLSDLEANGEEGVRNAFIIPPAERAPTARVGYRGKDGFKSKFVNPATGEVLPEAGTRGGTGFIFPFHYSLHLRAGGVGYWLVGLAGMAMMALLVSGVIVHVKIFRDFFTFRTDKKTPRVALDLHNVTGVLALPFHFLITLSGLVIFITIYFPSAPNIPYERDSQLFFNEAFGSYSRDKAGQPGSIGSLDAMAAEAMRLWGDGTRPFFVRIHHPGDANGYVEMRQSYENKVTMSMDRVYFDAASGAVLHRHVGEPVLNAQRFISGLHFIQFRHWTLRWVYFALGLSGCVLIVTGFLFWLESRRKRHTQQGLRGVRIVEGLTIGSTTGIIFATLGFFIVNRVLPLGPEHRDDIEFWAFYAIWVLTFAHAWLRTRRGWIEQCYAVAAAALLAVLLNAITTGDHMLRTLMAGNWPVFGMDSLMLAGGAIALATAIRLQRRQSTAQAVARPAGPIRTDKPEQQHA